VKGKQRTFESQTLALVYTYLGAAPTWYPGTLEKTSNGPVISSTCTGDAPVITNLRTLLVYDRPLTLHVRNCRVPVVAHTPQSPYS
jgi:hypothetical protein